MRLRKKQALRIVSSVLAASMALSAFPTAAFAAGTPQKTEAENSAVETQAEDSQDNLATLEFDENGLPIGEGNAEEGWTYDDSELTIYEGFSCDLGGQTINCSLKNYGNLRNGVFTHAVENYGTIENSTLSEYKESPDSTEATWYQCVNYGTFKDVSGEGIRNVLSFENSVIIGGKFASLSLYDESAVENADIAYLNASEGSTIKNSIFGGKSNGAFIPSDARVLKFAVESTQITATVNDIITVEACGWNEDSSKVYVVGDRNIKATYVACASPDFEFGGWTVDREIDGLQESEEQKTVNFTMPESNVVLTATERYYELEMEGGKPKYKGNKTSGWTYKVVNYDDGSTMDRLTIYSNYVHDFKGEKIDCKVENYGELSNGVFTRAVENYGVIKDSKISTYKPEDSPEDSSVSSASEWCYNYGTLENIEDVSESGVRTVNNYENGVIFGGKLKSVYNLNGGILKNSDVGELWVMEGGIIENTVFQLNEHSDLIPDNAKVLTFSDKATVNGIVKPYVWNARTDKVYVIGDRNVEVTYTGESEEFDGWNIDPEPTEWMEADDKKTISFTPNNDVTLTAKEKSYTLSIKDGKPEGKGNKTSGWTYDSTENRLTIYKGFEFEFGTQTIDCSVWNEGTIKNGVFTHGIENYGTVENSKFTSFKTGNDTSTTYGVSNSGMMIDVVDESDNTYNQYNGVIDGGKFGYIDNHNLVKNADIKKLHFSEGGSVENCVFGMWSGEDAPENAYVLTFSADATVNDFISVEPNEWDESSKKIFVVGNREVLVKYNGDAESFGGWKVTPEVEMEKVDDITVKFVNLTSDITLSATEKAVELTFDEDGYPVGKGNKTSGWTYDGYTLKFYEGYTFSQDVIVNCSVENAGTITDGTFTKGVSNYIWADGEQICGTVTGGIFAGLSIASDENMPENMYVLAAINSKINGVIDDTAEIVGENRKVTVTANLSDDEFESWNDVSGIGIDTDSKTLEFVMPSQNVILRINYKDRPLVIDEEGKPTCTGGKNWEYFERNDQVYLYDGYEFDSTTPVSVMVVAYPGATIKNGIFDGTVTSLGTIKDGTFNGFVNSVGVIEGGTFNDEVMNLTIDGAAIGGEYSDIPKCEGVIRGGTFNGLVANGSKLEGGTFNNFVVNTQNLAENMETGADAIGVISDGTFENEVVNLSTIEGGNFRKKVTNIGTISNGAFWSGVENTTYENLNPDSMSDHAIATMSLIETESFAIDMQNDASTTENYVGSITSGAFFGTVENKGGKITGGVFHSQLRGDAVENVHVLNAVDARIGTDVPNYNNTYAVFENTVYVVGQQGVYVRYVGEGEFGSWTSEDVELSTENMSADGKTVTFTMPGDKDVTLTVSTEKPVKPVVTYAVTVKNGKATVDGEAIEKAKKGDTVTITANAAAEGKEFAGWKVIEGGVTLDDASKTTTTFEMGEEAVTVEATYKDKTTKPTEPTKPDKPSEDTTITVDKDTKLDEDKIYDKDVKNDGIISKGEFTGEVTNNGTIENGTFTDTVTNNGTIKNGKFAGEVKGKGKIEGGTFQQVTEASEISGGVFGAQSDMSNAKVVPSTLKIESSVADSSLVNDVIGNGAAQALALFAENDIATQAADSAEMVAYVVGNQTLTVKYTGTDKSFDKWDTTGFTC